MPFAGAKSEIENVDDGQNAGLGLDAGRTAVEVLRLFGREWCNAD